MFMITKLLDFLQLKEFLALRVICKHYYMAIENPVYWVTLCDRYLIFYPKSDITNFKIFFMNNYVKAATFICVPDVQNCKVHDFSIQQFIYCIINKITNLDKRKKRGLRY